MTNTKMKSKIFKSNEILSILSKQKTMFREVIKPQPSRRECPYKVGQKIFCKETFAEIEFGGGMGYNSGKQMIYKADDDYDVKWKPAQHMKQEHSRLTLKITDIKVERLAEISEDDAIAEGLPLSNEFEDRYYTPEGNYATAKIAFMRWWNANHKKPEEKFEANPFVWVVEFKINKLNN